MPVTPTQQSTTAGEGITIWKQENARKLPLQILVHRDSSQGAQVQQISAPQHSTPCQQKKTVSKEQDKSQQHRAKKSHGHIYTNFLLPICAQSASQGSCNLCCTTSTSARLQVIIPDPLQSPQCNWTRPITSRASQSGSRRWGASIPPPPSSS